MNSNIPKYNPFFPYGMNPFMQPNSPMKTPEQYRQDILAQLNPQFENYNNMYAQAQKQATIQANSGQYIKVNSYDEVKNVQCPSNGKPIIVIDEANGVLYSKKFVDGQEYIKGFNLAPIENKSESQETPKTNAPASENNNPLDLIMEKLNNIENRLSKVEGVEQNVNTANATESTQTK